MNPTARNYYRDSRDPRKNYPTAAKDVHLQLLAKLSNLIDPSVNRVQYEAIIKRLTPYMVSVLSRKNKNFIDIFESLELIHFIEIGKYGPLKKVLREFDQRYVQIVETAEEEIRMIMKSHRQPKQPVYNRPRNSEDSFLSTVSEEASQKWVGRVPRKTKSRILTEVDLENFSEAINATKMEVVRTAFWLNSREMDQITQEARGSLSEARFLVLLKWQEKNGGRVCVNDIINRLSEAQELDMLSIDVVKARSAIENINLEMKQKRQV